MQTALQFKCQHMNEYIAFIKHFGPALTGMAFWNNNKNTKLISELLTITDEAFIHLSISTTVQPGRLRKNRNWETPM
jgi:O-glycosyl hydrolase